MLSNAHISGTGLLEGQTLDDTVEETKSKFVPTYVVSSFVSLSYNWVCH